MKGKHLVLGAVALAQLLAISSVAQADIPGRTKSIKDTDWGIMMNQDMKSTMTTVQKSHPELFEQGPEKGELVATLLGSSTVIVGEEKEGNFRVNFPVSAQVIQKKQTGPDHSKVYEVYDFDKGIWSVEIKDRAAVDRELLNQGREVYEGLDYTASTDKQIAAKFVEHMQTMAKSESGKSYASMEAGKLVKPNFLAPTWSQHIVQLGEKNKVMVQAGHFSPIGFEQKAYTVSVLTTPKDAKAVSSGLANYALPSFRTLDAEAVGGKVVIWDKAAFYIPGYFKAHSSKNEGTEQSKTFTTVNSEFLNLSRVSMASLKEKYPKDSSTGIFAKSVLEKMQIMRSKFGKPIDHVAVVYNEGVPGVYIESRDARVTPKTDAVKASAFITSDGEYMYYTFYVTKVADIDESSEQLVRDILQTVHYANPNNACKGLSVEDILGALR